MKKFYLAIILLGSGLRVWDIFKAPLWYDEIFSATLMRLPVLEMVRTTAGDTHPPLYYLLGGWDGDSARVISALCSVAGMLLLWRLVTMLKLPDLAGIVAVGLMAFAPVQIHYAQEARMYALLQALVIWMVITVLERNWMRASLISALMLYTHNYAVFYLPVLWMAAIVIDLTQRVVIPDPTRGQTDRDRTEIREIALAIGCAIAAYIPWMFVVAHQAAIIRGVYWIQPVTVGALLYSVYMLFWGFAIPPVIQALTVMVTFGILSVAVYIALRDKKWLLIWWAIAPLNLVIMACLIQPVLLFRGLIGIAPAMYMMLGYMVTRIPTRSKCLVTILAIPLLISGLVSYYQNNPANKGGWQPVIDQIRSMSVPRMSIIHTSVDTLVIWTYLAPDLDNKLLEMDCQRSYGSLSLETRQALGMISGTPAPGDVIVSSLGPMSTRCEELVTIETTRSAVPVAIIRNDELITQVVYVR